MKIKSNSVFTTTMDGHDRLVFSFEDGEHISINTSNLSPEIVQMAAMHGLKQKIADAAAMSRDPETGKSATTQDKRAAMQRVIDQLMEGSWNRRAANGEGKDSEGGLLKRALAELFPGKDIDTFLAGKTKAEQAALRGNPKVADIITKLRKPKGDSEAMLDELNSL